MSERSATERRISIDCRGAPGCYLFHRAPLRERAGAMQDEGGGPALIVCPGFIQNRKAFELPRRSFLEHLTRAGFHVYALELAKHVRHEGEGLAYYSDRAATAAVDYVTARHRHLAWIGHSMGGLIGVGLPPHVSAKLDAMVIIGAPLRPGFGVAAARGLEALFARVGSGLMREGRSFSGSRVAAWFHVGKPVLDHRLARYPLQIWAPGHLSREELEWALQNAFVEDSWGAFSDMLDLARTDGERAGWLHVGERLRALKPPLLVISADRDGLAPARSTRPLYERAGSADKRLVEVGVATSGVPFGHIDLLVGRHAPEHVWRPVSDFLVERLVTRVADTGPTPPSAGVRATQTSVRGAPSDGRC